MPCLHEGLGLPQGDDETGGLLPADSTCPHWGENLVSLSVATKTTVCRPLSCQPWHLSLPQRTRPALVSLLLGAYWATPDCAFKPPRGGLGDFLALQEILLYSKMRNTRKSPFFCCKLLLDGLWQKPSS